MADSSFAHFPSRFAAEFDFTVQNVCASSTLDPALSIIIWVFSPPDGTETGNYTITTITGPTPEFCVFNNTELSVTRPNGSSGTFNITFVSLQGQSAVLLVSYGTCIVSLVVVVKSLRLNRSVH